MSLVLVTGATGFIGSCLCNKLLNDGAMVRRALRRTCAIDGIVVGDLGPNTDWAEALEGIDCVVHLAARVHIMGDKAIDPLYEFRRVNVAGTLNLARQAAAAGIRRFIFMSSIKVNGEQTQPGFSFSADDVPAPVDPYGITKYEAEQGLWRLSEETGIEVVIIRPVLVYGPGVKANFFNMMKWIYRGIPLPFGSFHNNRSLVALDNLVDLIITCITNQMAANQVFLASDGEDLSTTDLLQRTAVALGKRARLLSVPQGLFELGLNLLGKRVLAQRLCGSLQVDISKTRKLLVWSPPFTVDEILKKTAADFLIRY